MPTNYLQKEIGRSGARKLQSGFTSQWPNVSSLAQGCKQSILKKATYFDFALHIEWYTSWPYNRILFDHLL